MTALATTEDVTRAANLVGNTALGLSAASALDMATVFIETYIETPLAERAYVDTFLVDGRATDPLLRLTAGFLKDSTVSIEIDGVEADTEVVKSISRETGFIRLLGTYNGSTIVVSYVAGFAVNDSVYSGVPAGLNTAAVAFAVSVMQAQSAALSKDKVRAGVEIQQVTNRNNAKLAANPFQRSRLGLRPAESTWSTWPV